jgi:hypothetical protein
MSPMLFRKPNVLATVTGAHAYQLERRLGHRSPRHIQRYTNPPEDVAATYVEGCNPPT